MQPPTPIPLFASRVEVGGAEFKMLVDWPFADPYVHRLLKNDIPHRVKFSNGRIWIFKDPYGQPVGFGAFDIWGEYSQLTGGKMHPYIPLLAVNPTIKSHGYGTSILNYLISEAALAARQSRMIADVLLLDVYISNHRAIALYQKAGFRNLIPQPLDDPDENEKYFIMGRRVTVANSG